MEEALKVERVIDKKKLGESIHAALDLGVELIRKDKISQTDFLKLKVLRNVGPFINAGVALVQQETAMVRANLIAERMKQLGYPSGNKQLGE